MVLATGYDVNWKILSLSMKVCESDNVAITADSFIIVVTLYLYLETQSKVSAWGYSLHSCQYTS